MAKNIGDVDATYPPKHDWTTTPNDAFNERREELDSPASSAFPITPSQGLLPTTVRSLYIGGSGNVFCRMAAGNTMYQQANAFFYNVGAGTVLPIRVDGVFDTNSTDGDISQNTTATFIVGLF